MAEIIERGNKKQKLSTRVDLTPMVDLGFLLITFFIFTNALSKPKGLKFYLPKPAPPHLQQPTPESGALTLLISVDRTIFYYEGADPGKMIRSDIHGVRQVIMDKKKRTDTEKFMVIIKPGKDSNFQALIRLMDEMNINDVMHYALVDIEPVEIELMHRQASF